MDLTPPSMSTSPASPEHDYSKSPLGAVDNAYPPPEASAASYPSPDFLDFTYRPGSPYDSLGPGSIAETIEVDSSLTQLDSMAQAAWNPPDGIVTSASVTSSAVGHLLPAEYDPFSNYHSCLPPQYASNEIYPAPPSATPALTRSPAPSLDASSSRTSLSVGPRSSLGYNQDQTTPRVKMETPNTYSPAMEPIHYANGTPVQPSYQHQPYLHENLLPSWPKQDMESTAMYSAHSVPTPAMEHSSRGRSSTAPPRARRPARKHTTREEANFQCQVKGCGKFFSRSYNFKSHMETHDEKREYPFPCPINDCNKKFVRKTDLQRHHQSVHMKERNHRCDYCGRMFARKDTLRRHMEDGCSKRFDIGTLDIRSGSYGATQSGGRGTRSSANAKPSLTPVALPPLGPAHIAPLQSVRDTHSGAPGLG